MGLTPRQLWGLTPRELDALTVRRNAHSRMLASMFYQLRADVHNSSEYLQREDKQRWKAADFGAEDEPEIPKTPEEIKADMEFQQMKLMCLMPPKVGGLSIVARMKQEKQGQPIPPAKWWEPQAG